METNKFMDRRRTEKNRWKAQVSCNGHSRGRVSPRSPADTIRLSGEWYPLPPYKWWYLTPTLLHSPHLPPSPTGEHRRRLLRTRQHRSIQALPRRRQHPQCLRHESTVSAPILPLYIITTTPPPSCSLSGSRFADVQAGHRDNSRLSPYYMKSVPHFLPTVVAYPLAYAVPKISARVAAAALVVRDSVCREEAGRRGGRGASGGALQHTVIAAAVSQRPLAHHEQTSPMHLHANALNIHSFYLTHRPESSHGLNIPAKSPRYRTLRGSAHQMGTCLSPQREGINHRTARPRVFSQRCVLPGASARTRRPASWLLRRKKFRITNKVVFLPPPPRLSPISPRPRSSSGISRTLFSTTEKAAFWQVLNKTNHAQVGQLRVRRGWREPSGSARRSARFNPGSEAPTNRPTRGPRRSSPSATSSRPCLCSVLLSRQPCPDASW
ncbi:hypothetical protein C8Q74DRAFT_524447 [Fomes fomentarius]|nr:hypothetical protein C8Q74DRAFT_524447 [Fomes fomentarius]